MNWGKIVIAGVVAGVVLWLVDFVLHGWIMASAYLKYPGVFTQEEASPFWFLAVAICIAITVAILFAKTCDCWASGLTGGATFGFFLGLVAFFGPFYFPLVLEGFPYYLAWCWGGIHIIEAVIGGAVIGAIYKKA